MDLKKILWLISGYLFITQSAIGMGMSGMGMGGTGSSGMGGMMGGSSSSIPPSLQGQGIPAVSGLVDGTDPIIVDKDTAIALGKALFWDTNVGSDGMACASCHFHAGADGRVKNQLNSGQNSTEATGKTFERTASGLTGGVNYTLNNGDFPLHKFQNPLNNQSAMSFSTDDVVGSSGSFGGQFTSVPPVGTTKDTCNRTVDPIFHVGATGTRRVTARNAPSVINAVFNSSNFWDGRAKNVFNGSSLSGSSDTTAGVWIKQSNGTVNKTPLNLSNSSLASQSTAPPLNDTEMSCNQRAFPDLGRKLLQRKPLETQKVHNQDSVLGLLRNNTSGKGLNTTYNAMIKKAFNQKYWAYNKTDKFGKPMTQTSAPPYTQIEANFSMFFGLAIQMYESTLVSDQALFDTSPRDSSSVPTAFNDSEKRGLNLFVQDGCVSCHAGTAFTAAAVGSSTSMMMAMDFVNTGVSNPISDSGKSGTFKTPTLRNVELTGPYMHNGDMATLEQVVEFYSRQGNFSSGNSLRSMMASMMFNFSGLASDAQGRADVVAFLKTLTDDRVRYEKAPFDHPEIAIPHGQKGNTVSIVANNPLGTKLGTDEFLTLPAVGRDGNVNPILPFQNYLAP